MTKDDREIVSAVRSRLADKVGQERFNLWFGAAMRLDYNGGALRIGAPSQFFLEWIRTNFRRHVEEACCEVFGTCPALEFHLDATSASDEARRTKATKIPCSRPRTRPQRRSRRRVAQPPSAAPADSHGADGRATPPSRAAPPRRRFASLDTFVAGETNRLAIASAEMVVRQPGQLTPLMFHGPTSVGKTHLLEGIWTAARKTHQRLTAVYLSAEQFTSHFLEALRGSGLPSFRRKYRGVGCSSSTTCNFSWASARRRSNCCTRSIPSCAKGGNWCSPPTVRRPNWPNWGRN